MSPWEVVIGLEVHCQLRTRTKMFSACPSAFGQPPNTLVDPYTLGLPGTLPVANVQAVDYAIALALATRCEIAPISYFARKHYFYPDLPKGYQITQSEEPYATGGFVEFTSPDDDALRRIALVRIHLEEDAGKSLHDQDPSCSLLDHNRAGAPLLEIVSEPEIRSARDAAAYLRELRSMVRALGISQANMEEGSLRCDANVSVRQRGAAELGTRCEIKNLNSFRFLEQAIEAECRRQIDVLEDGGEVIQATMSFDPASGRTAVMRTKEDAADYRYLPDPDLPPLRIAPEWVERVRASMPELPAARRERYGSLGLRPEETRVFVADPALGAYLDAVLVAGAPPRKALGWVGTILFAQLKAEGRPIGACKVSPQQLAGLIALVENGAISGTTGKEVFERCLASGEDPLEVVEREGLRQESDAAVLKAELRAVLAGAQEQVSQWKAGNQKVRGWFVGQMMKRTGGQANPKMVAELLAELLGPAGSDEP